jgi:hypothetical protein
MPAAPPQELMWPRALRRYWSRHQRSGRAGRHEPGPDDTRRAYDHGAGAVVPARGYAASREQTMVDFKAAGERKP